MASDRARAPRQDGVVSTPRAPRPYYVPVANEERIFKAAFRQGMSVVLKGPTGCGKTRFLEAMAYDLDRPLITVACHYRRPLSRRGTSAERSAERNSGPITWLSSSALGIVA